MLSAEAAEVANEDFGPTGVKRHENDRTYVTFDCTNPEFAVSKVLAAKGAIQVTRGDRLKARIVAELDAIADAYPVADEVTDVA